MDISDEKKEEIQGLILDRIEDALGEKLIEENEVKEVAGFVVSKIKEVNDQADLVNFLSDLSSKWSLFKDTYEIEKGRVDQQEALSIASQATQLAKEGKIEEAIDLTKTLDTQ